MVSGIVLKVSIDRPMSRRSTCNVHLDSQDTKEDLQLSVITDRAEGGGSIEDGAAELMVSHRCSLGSWE